MLKVRRDYWVVAARGEETERVRVLSRVRELDPRYGPLAWYRCCFNDGRVLCCHESMLTQWPASYCGYLLHLS